MRGVDRLLAFWMLKGKMRRAHEQGLEAKDFHEFLFVISAFLVVGYFARKGFFWEAFFLYSGAFGFLVAASMKPKRIASFKFLNLVIGGMGLAGSYFFMVGTPFFHALPSAAMGFVGIHLLAWMAKAAGKKDVFTHGEAEVMAALGAWYGYFFPLVMAVALAMAGLVRLAFAVMPHKAAHIRKITFILIAGAVCIALPGLLKSEIDILPALKGENSYNVTHGSLHASPAGVGDVAHFGKSS